MSRRKKRAAPIPPRNFRGLRNIPRKRFLQPLKRFPIKIETDESNTETKQRTDTEQDNASKEKIFFASRIEENEDVDKEIEKQPSPVKKWQLSLSKRKKQLIKIKSRIKSCQLKLEQQDEQLKSLQEQIAKKRAICKRKEFDWNAVKAAHLISKVFERCGPVISSDSNEHNQTDFEKDDNDKNKGKEANNKSKCLYTADFHRFAIALYFFSPKAYFFLSNIAPMFPHRNYIRQWVTSGRVEKLFPQGVYREEFNDVL